MPVFAQELPELPYRDGPKEPLLGPEDIVPEKPYQGETLPQTSDKKTDSPEQKSDILKELFARLKRTADIKEAAKINRQIQGLWAQSGSETIDLLMSWVDDAVRSQDYAKALDYLDNVVALEPEYAEGWMRRASVHIQTNNIVLAMIELEMVLRIEPRQYNAMLQLGTIMEMTDRNDLAIDAYQKALAVYPQLLRAQTRIGELLEDKTGQAI